jgi:hypothetical protein
MCERHDSWMGMESIETFFFIVVYRTACSFLASSPVWSINLDLDARSEPRQANLATWRLDFLLNTGHFTSASTGHQTFANSQFYYQ